MFEVLKQVRQNWNDSQFIILKDDVNKETAYYWLLPAQAFTLAHIQFIRSNSGSCPILGIGDKFAKYIDIPILETIYEGISSRYQLINSLLRTNQHFAKSNSLTPAISHRDTVNGVSNIDIVKTISTLGDIADEFMNESHDRYEFIDKFASLFYIPGHIQMHRAKRALLESRLSIVEFGLALTELTNHAPAVCIMHFQSNTSKQLTESQVKKFANQHSLTIITAKTVINLYRSINKIPKNRIAKVE